MTRAKGADYNHGRICRARTCFNRVDYGDLCGECKAPGVPTFDTEYAVMPAMKQRACKDMDVNIFIEIRDKAQASRAKGVCNDCPVRAGCLAYADSTHEGVDPYPVVGVWGGVWFQLNGNRVEIEDQVGSGFYWSSRDERYIVAVRVNGRRRRGGSFKTPEEAQARADALRAEMFAEVAA